jgi:hypothetical protein
MDVAQAQDNVPCMQAWAQEVVYFCYGKQDKTPGWTTEQDSCCSVSEMDQARSLIGLSSRLSAMMRCYSIHTRGVTGQHESHPPKTHYKWFRLRSLSYTTSKPQSCLCQLVQEGHLLAWPPRCVYTGVLVTHFALNGILSKTHTSSSPYLTHREPPSPRLLSNKLGQDTPPRSVYIKLHHVTAVGFRDLFRIYITNLV